MNLRDLIERLQALRPSSALDADVVVVVGDDDFQMTDVRYSDGRVTIEVDASEQSTYDEGYEDGFRDGKKTAGDDDD